jgi:hypothetical protein
MPVPPGVYNYYRSKGLLSRAAPPVRPLDHIRRLPGTVIALPVRTRNWRVDPSGGVGEDVSAARSDAAQQETKATFDKAVAANIAAGMSPADATRAAQGWGGTVGGLLAQLGLGLVPGGRLAFGIARSLRSGTVTPEDATTTASPDAPIAQNPDDPSATLASSFEPSSGDLMGDPTDPTGDNIDATSLGDTMNTAQDPDAVGAAEAAGAVSDSGLAEGADPAATNGAGADVSAGLADAGGDFSHSTLEHDGYGTGAHGGTIGDKIGIY